MCLSYVQHELIVVLVYGNHYRSLRLWVMRFGS